MAFLFLRFRNCSGQGANRFLKTAKAELKKAAALETNEHLPLLDIDGQTSRSVERYAPFYLLGKTRTYAALLSSTTLMRPSS